MPRQLPWDRSTGHPARVDLVLVDPGHGWKGLATVYRASPVRVGRVQLVVPEPPGTYDPEIALETADGRGELQRVATVPLRPRLRDQNPALGPLGQDLLLKPRPIQALRIVQLGARPYPWAISELRVYERSRDEPQ